MFPDKNSQYSDKAYWDAPYNSQKCQHKRQEEGTGRSDETLISTETPFYDWFESVNNMAELIDCIIQEKLGVVSEQTRSLNSASVQNCTSTSRLKLLMNGCGNSRLGELLVGRGYTFIVNIDFQKRLFIQCGDITNPHIVFFKLTLASSRCTHYGGPFERIF